MPITYATPAELAAWMNPGVNPVPAPPANAAVLIRVASDLVLEATRGAMYATNASGVATDVGVYAALHEATLTQAEAWSLREIDPRLGASAAPRRVASKSLGGASVSYVADSRADTELSELASGTVLTAAARRILRSAGLITTGIIDSRAGSAGVVIEQRAYDPTTGAFLP